MKPHIGIDRVTGFIAHLVCIAGCASLAAPIPEAPLFTVHEVQLRAAKSYGNPYRELEANVVLTPPEGGAERTAPLFWDSDATWKLRFSPDRIGEWHAEIATRGSTEEAVRKEFIELGTVIQNHDPHRRMMAIHPMHSNGSTREFNETSWMSFGDYQQNYDDLHGRIRQSLRFNQPVVNSEYGYYLRDQDGDGNPDKENSTTLDIMRHATWDIVMAGGYVVTGFGTTYYGGNRDPGPFDLKAEKNKPWEAQIGHMRKLFTGFDWWRFESHDELLRCGTPRGRDRRHLERVAPPETAYWCLAEPGRVYLLYVRGLKEPVDLALGPSIAGLKARQWNPRTAEFTPIQFRPDAGRFSYRPPDGQDWLVVLD